MIGIISAMREEIQALLDNLQNVTTSIKGMRTYYKGTLFNKEVVMVFSRWGKVASAITTTQLINDYHINELIFTGVAGSVKSDLNIGDVVVGKNLFQHDLDASPIYEKFEIPILENISFETNIKNRKKLIKSTRKFLNSYHDVISKEEASKFNIKNPKIIIGDIASGDQFINSREKVAELNKLLPSVVCVEMEGAAVAQVCFEYKVKFSIIRIISDKANDNAHIEFQKFAHKIATKYALEIFKIYFN